jgi:hypothetical protein
LKAKKALKINQEMKMRLGAKQALIKKATQQRTLMQSRLKEVFMRSQKNPSQNYRNANGFISTSISGKSISNASSSATSGFFDKNSHRSTQSSRKFQADFFGSSSSTMSSLKGTNKDKNSLFDSTSNQRSQSTRTPFYV